MAPVVSSDQRRRPGDLSDSRRMAAVYIRPQHVNHLCLNREMTDLEAGYLSVREAARRLGVHENTIRNWVANGILESARLPGARFHRFSEAEVERVRLARTTEPVGVGAERRILGPELADANRLIQWADSYDASAVFPRLVRRLLAVTPRVTELYARAGEGVRP